MIMDYWQFTPILGLVSDHKPRIKWPQTKGERGHFEWSGSEKFWKFQIFRKNVKISEKIKFQKKSKNFDFQKKNQKKIWKHQ
jgi:uncharacterized protein (DUF2249 family)